MEKLKVENLRVKYKNFDLDLSFSLFEGEFVSIIGPSGSGKSTILSAIAGLNESFSGKIYLNDKDITNEKIQNRNIGMVFQNYSLFSNMDVEKNVGYSLKINKVNKKERSKQVKELLNLVGLSGYEKRKVTTLSGGEAQRVKLATELSKKPTGKTLYILDEPTTGLHIADVHKLVDILQRLVDTGNTIVVIEHNLDLIKTADYIIDLGPEGGDAGGTIVQVGTPEQIVKNEKSYTGKFLKEYLTQL